MQREKSQMETVGKSREREGEKKERIVPVKNKKKKEGESIKIGENT